MFLSNFCIAKDKVLFKGHAVAGVSATSKLIAEQALSLIKVEYEVLKPVMRPEEAIKPDAPILHEKLVTINSTTIRAGGISAEELPKDQQTNLANKFEFALGDIDKGFKGELYDLINVICKSNKVNKSLNDKFQKEISDEDQSFT